MQLQISQLIKMLEIRFNLPARTLIPVKGKAGRPRHYNGLNLPEIRRALIVYALVESCIGPCQFERWFGFDHSSFSKSAKKGLGFLQMKDEVFMRYYNLVCELASTNPFTQPKHNKN